MELEFPINFISFLDTLPSELIVLLCTYLDNDEINATLKVYRVLFDTSGLKRTIVDTEKIYEDLVLTKFPQDYQGVKRILIDCNFIWKDTYEDLNLVFLKLKEQKLSMNISYYEDVFFPGQIYELYKRFPKIYEFLVECDKPFKCNKYILQSRNILTKNSRFSSLSEERSNISLKFDLTVVRTILPDDLYKQFFDMFVLPYLS